MRKIFFLIFILFTVLNLFSISNLKAQDAVSNSSHVIVKIEGLTLEQYNSIATVYMKNPDIDLPYYCLESGIIAIHYRHTGLSNADVQLSVRTELKRVLKHNNIRILDVETHKVEDDSRC